MTKDITQRIINNIEDYVGGNIEGVENVDHMSFTRFLRGQIEPVAEAYEREKKRDGAVAIYKNNIEYANQVRKWNKATILGRIIMAIKGKI